MRSLGAIPRTAYLLEGSMWFEIACIGPLIAKSSSVRSIGASLVPVAWEEVEVDADSFAARVPAEIVSLTIGESVVDP